ncbi:ADM_collapsed_G0036100.mRNA.1.CDS.1 [Saccharomyces cerevisiae]|nr:ADM_collapsed_G0036100.mRNA.1.CDS.1 [Saccharomyces cerevisiae]
MGYFKLSSLNCPKPFQKVKSKEKLRERLGAQQTPYVTIDARKLKILSHLIHLPAIYSIFMV